MGLDAVTGVGTEHTVTSITGFAIAKFEIQYGDWLTVKSWATSNGYTFANPGVPGDNGARTNQDPVTTVNWRDSIIWCNAASQKAGLTPVYYTDSGFALPLKIVDNAAVAGATTTAGAEDNPYVNWSANGYRLPTEAEWEYAARYIDGTTFMRGDAPSGWEDNNPANAAIDTAENNAVAWYATNSGGVTHPVGAALGNALGLFDMSGNVYEWVWDWNGTYTTSTPYTDADSKGASGVGSLRVARGGSLSSAATDVQTSFRNNSPPSSSNNALSFRPVRRP